MSIRGLRARAVLVCLVVPISLSLLAGSAAAKSAHRGLGPRFVAKPTNVIAATPSATRPHWACPRERCLAIVDPPQVRRGSRYALPQREDVLEGNGEHGGYDPADLVSAYNIPSSTESTQTIAVVDEFGYAAAESDLAKYRERYGLPECTKESGCFKRVNEKGEEANYPTETGEGARGWQGESALDIEMASAACPSCRIMLVETTPEELESGGIETALNGATEVSLSFGAPEQFYCQAGLCTGKIAHEILEFYTRPGVPIVAAAGDSSYNEEQLGYKSPSWPASLPNVIAAGGTSLRKFANARGWEESVWDEGGPGGFETATSSGCSGGFEQPSWQYSLETGCENRLDNDVAAVAACQTPVSVYHASEGGWLDLCGTSVSAPLTAGILAHASASVRSAGARAFYEGTSTFDVFLGNDRFEGHSCPVVLWCTALHGYDGPTGTGTPNGVPATVRPYVSSVEPNEGPEGGGTSVTISGSGFEPGEAVYFGGKPAKSVNIESLTSAKATAPAGSGTVDVTFAGESALEIHRADHFIYQARTDLAYSGPTQALDEQTITLTATLTEHATKAPIAGRVAEFTVGAEHCEATTNGSGVASCSVSIADAPGSYTLTVKVAAGAGLGEGSSHIGFTVFEPAVFGRCLKASSQKIGSKVVYNGAFTTSSCTEKSPSKEGKFEWYPGPGPKTHFALAIKPATTIKLETVGKHSLVCTAATGEGSVTGFKTVQMGLVLRGCSEEGEICGNIGAGEVQIFPLQGSLGWQDRALKKVDLDLTVGYLYYECAKKAVFSQTTGILLPMTVDKFSTNATDKFTESKGTQVPDALEGGPTLAFEEDRLTGFEPVTETWEKETREDAGLSATLLQTYEEAYEINTVF